MVRPAANATGAEAPRHWPPRRRWRHRPHGAFQQGDHRQAQRADEWRDQRGRGGLREDVRRPNRAGRSSAGRSTVSGRMHASTRWEIEILPA